MSIEFRCSGCGKLLRVGDDAAGRQMQCPACNQIGTVPVGSAQAGAGQNQFQPTEQAFPQQEQNPFQSPTQPGGPSPEFLQGSEYAAGRVAGPAIGLIVAASVSLAFFACLTAIYVLVLVMVSSGRNFGNQPADPSVGLGAVIMIIIGVIGVIRGILLIVGAVKLKKLDSYGFAMTAAILAVIPCCSCFPVEIPFGIWALVVLNDPAVRAAFRR
jgi:hypothetical protein